MGDSGRADAGGARRRLRRDLLRRSLLVAGGVALGVGTAERWWSTHRRAPLDDGPAPQWTPMVLDTLAQHRVALRGLTDMINGPRARGYTFAIVSALLGVGVALTPTR